MIALIAVFLAIALILCFVAVIIYSPRLAVETTRGYSSWRGKWNSPYETLQELLKSLQAQVQRKSDYDGTVSSMCSTQCRP